MLGVFDSGLGGLSSIKELSRCLPNEDIVYFGDTGRVPYGTRSREIITQYALQDARFLMQFSPRAILVACGTVSSVAMETLQESFEVPIVGVVDAAVDAALEKTKNQKIAVLGTPATVRSGSYAKKLKEKREGVEVISIPCPLFVPLVENGHLDPNDPIVKATVAHYLHEATDFGADTVILGCTHYPLLKQAIGSFIGEEVSLVNAAAEAAKALKGILCQTPTGESGKQRFFVSDSPEGFADTAQIFLQKDIKKAVERVDIGSY